MGKREKNAFDSNTKLNGKAFETEQGKYISNQQMKEFIKVKAYLDLFRRLLILANARHTNLETFFRMSYMYLHPPVHQFTTMEA